MFHRSGIYMAYQQTTDNESLSHPLSECHICFLLFLFYLSHVLYELTTLFLLESLKALSLHYLWFGPICQVLDRTSRLTQLVSGISVGSRVQVSQWGDMCLLEGIPKEGIQCFQWKSKKTRIQGSRAIDKDRTGEYYYNQSNLYSTRSVSKEQSGTLWNWLGHTRLWKGRVIVGHTRTSEKKTLRRTCHHGTY